MENEAELRIRLQQRVKDRGIVDQDTIDYIVWSCLNRMQKDPESNQKVRAELLREDPV
jgi:hypothetical protein